MEEVTLQQMLEAREARVRAQEALVGKYGLPLVSFCMNIPGPVKSSPLILRGFQEGITRLELALHQQKLAVVWSAQAREITGPEALYVVDAPASRLKALCLELEEQDGLGRLFDMDVLAPDGAKLDRPTPRACLVCGKAGKGCASRRVHSVAQLQEAVRDILTDHFRNSDRERCAALVTQALLDEVCTTPKPGLVDRANAGSHRDMDIFTFTRSAAALAPYWLDCVRIGQETAHLPPAETFPPLRERGKVAEREMYRATGGINTHKGAIFTLGILCGAVGRLWRAEAPCRDPEALAMECARIYGPALESDRQAMAETAMPQTAGERLWLTQGVGGVRAEVAGGLPGVIRTALPALEDALNRGCSRNDAGVTALLHLIALGEDTNMVHRGGAAAAQAGAQAAALLAASPLPDLARVAELDARFMEQNLSPGGCADLLSAAWFLHDWKNG